MIQEKRKHLRLKYYDYSDTGYYFVTICTRDKLNLFGEIIDGKMQLNEWGRIVHQCWTGIPCHFEDVLLDYFIIMPNHIHGIVVIENCRGLMNQTPATQK